MATTCPECGGSLRRGPLYGNTQSLQCRSCNGWFEQRVPRWWLDALALPLAA